MLEELRITGLGVISEAVLGLHPGLTVVTGETGAGKTMVVSGIGLLLGARADPKVVRRGAERATVEGRFTDPPPRLAEQVTGAGGRLDDDAELLVARHVTATGRSRAYLGGAQVPAGVCAQVTEELVVVHGQSDQVRLVDPGRQRDLLDRFADDLTSTLVRYRQRFAEHRSAAAELADLHAREAERAREVDLLRFGQEEIDRVGPGPTEDVDLAAEATRLQAADDLREAAHRAMAALAGSDDEAGGALSGVVAARRSLDHLAGRDPGASALAGRAGEVAVLVTDLAGDLARYLDDLDDQPGRLEQIAARRAELATLTRKYGPTCADVLRFRAETERRLAALVGVDDRIAELTVRVAELDAELDGLAGEISAGRQRAAEEIARRVGPELAALAMPHARLEFGLSPVDRGPDGADAVEIRFSANPGSEPRGLGKVASGGELSRVRLALEVVLAAGREPGTFVFDEVDAGVGGRVAVEIGRRLAGLARHAQVVVVTHLAQVAAFADRHYVVVKADDGAVTTSGVAAVSDRDRTAELARMMAGLETSESAMAHAEELLAEARTGR